MIHAVARAAPPALCIALFLLSSGCLPARQPTGPLPPFEPGKSPLSDYKPEHPFDVDARGVASRTAFSAPGAIPGVRLELRDLTFPPSAAPVPLQLSGAAVLIVVSGQGVASLDQKPIELKAGAAVTVPEGASLSLQARGEPLALRVHLFIGE